MKSLRKILRKTAVFALAASFFLGAGLVSCASSDDEEENVTKTVKVTLAETSEKTAAYTLEKGKTIADITYPDGTKYKDPSREEYTFGGWYDADGTRYPATRKITKDVVLSATWSKETKTKDNPDGTKTETTESESADGSKSTTEVTKDENGKTTETKTTTEKSDGTKETVTEKADGTKTTETVNKNNTSITVTEKTADDGSKTTETVEKDGSGKVTQTTEVTETSDGKVTTTVTDANGKTTTTETQKEYKKYIDAGIKALEKETPDIDSAVENFKKAYTTEANDETRVYSALASLASISTKKATADFVKNHLGITNYPSTMNALFSPDWLQAVEYIDYEDEEWVYGCKGFKESNPNEVTGYLYGYSSFTKTSSSSYYNTYYRCSVKPVDNYNYESVAVYKFGIYKRETIEGKTAYFKLDELESYEQKTNGSSDITDYYKVTLDENGDYYVNSGYLSGVDTSSAIAYTDGNSVSVNYTYTDTSSTSSYSGYYRCSITPADYYDYNNNTVGKWSICKKITISGKEIYGRLSDIAEYERDTTGSTQYNSEYYTYTLNNNGEYYVSFYVNSDNRDKFAGYKMYKQTDWDEAEYTYDVKTKFATLNVPSWLKNSSLNNNLSALLLANILEGNTNGLNSALDDFYSLIFDSSEYKEAITKLDEITTSVKVPANVIEDFGLTDIVGNTSVKLGPAELGLVKTAFTALKATVEYFQSYNLNSDLSFLKFDWNDDQAIQKVFEKYLKYDASIDPLKTGFLSQRSASKMESSKADFAQAVSDLIAAYDDILANSGDYPTVVSDTLEEYKILRDGAEKLQAAIKNGGKFYIPSSLVSEEATEDDLLAIASWPTSGDKYVDFGKLFDNATFNLCNYVSKDGDVPSIRSMNSEERYDKTTDEYYTRYYWAKQYRYYSKTLNKYKTIEFSDAKLSATDTKTNKKVVNLLLDAYKDADYLDDDEIGEGTLGIQVNLRRFEQIFGGFDITDYVTSIAGYHIDTNSDKKTHYIKVPLGIIPGLYVYNFYHDGEITEDLKSIISAEYDDDDDEEWTN